MRCQGLPLAGVRRVFDDFHMRRFADPSGHSMLLLYPIDARAATHDGRPRGSLLHSGQSPVESVSRWGQGLNVKQAAPTRKKGHFDVFERI